MTTYTTQQLLQEYIYQRQQGVPPNSALQFLSRLEPSLEQEKRKELTDWIRQWEADRQKQPAAAIVPSPGAAPAPSQSAPPESEPQQLPEPISCPHCKTQNPADSKYCYSCGDLLVAPIDRGSTEQLDINEADPAMFGNLATLLIAVRGHDQNPLRVDVGDKQLIIGRSDDTRPAAPDIDLAPYDAKNLGVSRSHAILKRQDNTITIIDQDSINHTYINGVKIHPHEVRVIRDGDEIRFGKLTARVTFYRELRRLG